MKIALLADIHGNADALESVLDAAMSDRVERLLVAGDMVGYYYRPADVLDLLDQFPWDAVRGNHEDQLAQWIAGEDRDLLMQRFGSGYAAAAETMSAPQLDRLFSLPRSASLTIGNQRVLLCHGTPDWTNTYVFPDASTAEIATLVVERHGLTVYGHTHYPVQWTIGTTRIVNPGSVGQPRNRVPGAHWALWDSDAGTVEARVQRYDPSALAAECRRRDPHLPLLADVLTRI